MVAAFEDPLYPEYISTDPLARCIFLLGLDQSAYARVIQRISESIPDCPCNDAMVKAQNTRRDLVSSVVSPASSRALVVADPIGMVAQSVSRPPSRPQLGPYDAARMKQFCSWCSGNGYKNVRKRYSCPYLQARMARHPVLAALEEGSSRKPRAPLPAALAAPLDDEAIIRSVQLAMDQREGVAAAAAASSALALPSTYVLAISDPQYFHTRLTDLPMPLTPLSSCLMRCLWHQRVLLLLFPCVEFVAQSPVDPASFGISPPCVSDTLSALSVDYSSFSFPDESFELYSPTALLSGASPFSTS